MIHVNIHKKLLLSRAAFTMLELVMVIVVLGILASLAIPRMERDLKQEAADSILSNIRYTQHLAQIDFKHDFADTQWQRKFWQIQFQSCANDSGLFMTVGSDVDEQGDIDRVKESAIDPSNAKPMFWTNTNDCSNGGDETVSDNIFITKKYGVYKIKGGGGCKGIQYIGFDHLGRPHIQFSGSTEPNYASYMKTSCTFTFTLLEPKDDTFQITIEPETGYAYIVDQNAS